MTDILLGSVIACLVVLVLCYIEWRRLTQETYLRVKELFNERRTEIDSVISNEVGEVLKIHYRDMDRVSANFQDIGTANTYLRKRIDELEARLLKHENATPWEDGIRNLRLEVAALIAGHNRIASRAQELETRHDKDGARWCEYWEETAGLKTQVDDLVAKVYGDDEECSLEEMCIDAHRQSMENEHQLASLACAVVALQSKKVKAK